MLTRKILIQNLTDHVLEGLFLDENMRDDINNSIYDEVANELKDLRYEKIYISDVQKAVVKGVLHLTTAQFYYINDCLYYLHFMTEKI